MDLGVFVSLLLLQLGSEKFNGVLSDGSLHELHTPCISCDSIIKAKELPVCSYGLGWFVEPYRGRHMIHHGGNIDGFSSLVAFMPYEKIGIVILTNMNGSFLIQFEFFGKASHAAGAPHEGINALDAVIQTFNGINALRQHILPDARIHGIIPEGGKAANVVPDYAVAQFYVRGTERAYVNELLDKVKNCAKAAALATGARLESSFYELSYDDLKTNETLSDAFTQNMIELGVDPDSIHEKADGGGSVDMGNVSQIAPSIHP